MVHRALLQSRPYGGLDIQQTVGLFCIEGAVIAADMHNVGWRKGTAHENKIRFQPLCVQLVQIYTDSFSQLIDPYRPRSYNFTDFLLAFAVAVVCR